MFDYLTELENKVKNADSKYEKNISQLKQQLVNSISETNSENDRLFEEYNFNINVNQEEFEKEIADLKAEKEKFFEIFNEKKKGFVKQIVLGQKQSDEQAIQEKSMYEQAIQKNILSQENYDEINVKRYKKQKDSADGVIEQHIIKLRETADAHREILDRSSQLFLEQSTNQKNFIMEKSRITNDQIKEIKKRYFEKNDALLLAKNKTLEQFDNEIKELTQKNIDKQKDILAEFKNKLIAIDKEINLKKRDINIKNNKLSLKYEKLMMFKKKSMGELSVSYRKSVKKEKNKKELEKQYKLMMNGLKKEYKRIVKDYEKNNVLLKKQGFSEIENLKLSQRVADLEKSKQIAINQIETDHLIMIVQEKIKLENMTWEINKRHNQLEELKEIMEIEIYFSNEDNENNRINQMLVCDNSYYSTECEIEINTINAEIAYYDEREKIAASIYEKRYETQKLKNYILSNLNIERAKIIKEHNINMLKLRHNSLVLNANLNTESYQLALNKRLIHNRRKVEMQNLTLVNKNDNAYLKYEQKSITNKQAIEIKKVSYTASIEIEKLQRILDIVNAEQDSFHNILTKIKEEFEINEKKFLDSTMYKNHDSKALKNKINDSICVKNEIAAEYCGIIKRIINGRIDLLSAYKYSAFRAGIIDEFENERNVIFNHKNEVQEILQKNNREINNLEYEEILKEHDLSGYIGQRNLMLMENKLSREVRQEITDISKKIATLNWELADVRKKLSIKKKTKKRLEHQLIIHDEIFLRMNKSINNKLDNLTQKRHHEMRIYYSCIAKINDYIADLATHFSSKAIKIYEQIDNQNGYNTQGLPQFINALRVDQVSFSNKVAKILNKLYMNVVHEHEENHHRFSHRSQKRAKSLSISTAKQLKIINYNQKKRTNVFLLNIRLLRRQTLNNLKEHRFEVKKFRQKFKQQNNMNRLEQKTENRQHQNTLRALDENYRSIRRFYTSLYINHKNKCEAKLAKNLFNFKTQNENFDSSLINTTIKHAKNLEMIRHISDDNSKSISHNYQKRIIKLHNDTISIGIDIENAKKDFNAALVELNYEKNRSIDSYMSKYRFDLANASAETKRKILSEFSNVYRRYRALIRSISMSPKK